MSEFTRRGDVRWLVAAVLTYVALGRLSSYVTRRFVVPFVEDIRRHRDRLTQDLAAQLGREPTGAEFRAFVEREAESAGA